MRWYSTRKSGKSVSRASIALGSCDLSLSISVHFRDAAIDMAKNANKKQTKGIATNVIAVILRIFRCRSVIDRKKQQVLSM